MRWQWSYVAFALDHRCRGVFWVQRAMMMSSNGNIFRVTSPLCGEFTGYRWIPRTKARDAELWCFLWSAPWIYGWVNNREAGDLRRHRTRYDVIVMHVLYMFHTHCGCLWAVCCCIGPCYKEIIFVHFTRGNNSVDLKLWTFICLFHNTQNHHHKPLEEQYHLWINACVKSLNSPWTIVDHA